ncbi:hypothetical protein EV127DRAFT_404112 [Xylaria flabelliformis]|nr:hypothetical protein EV127DRAFT_404112 [Xylaria flabelliformis]
MLYLPYEIVAQIASNKRLSRRDLAAMRLVCRFFTVPVTAVLFRQVKMSRLRADRDSFEHIAASEHLARHVRELVCQPGISEISTSCDDDFVLVCDLMAGASWDTDLFWFPRTPLRDLPNAIDYLLPSERDKQSDHKPMSDYQNFISSSVGWFVTTLDKFPNLTALISRPMPRGRVVTYKEYPIELDLYRYRERRYTDYDAHNDTGFFSYFLEAMKRVGSNVRTLSRQDKLHNYRANFGTESLLKHNTAFQALTRIDLCPILFNEEQREIVISCLKAATNLEHLSLCFGRLTHNLDFTLIDSCNWTTLTSLELFGNRFANLPLVSFLNRCTGIRHLVLQDCIVKSADILKLREKSSCQLTSIFITCEAASHSYLESNLLDFVNRRSSVLLDSDGDSMETIGNHRICTELSNGDDSMPTSSDTEEEEKESTLNHPWYWEEPYWSWGEFGPSHDIYCWQVDDIDEAQAGTTIWSFKGRNGRTLYGDPLEYFSDIDSKDGLEITPLPWGLDFFRALSSFIPYIEPPPGAIRYDEEDYAITACERYV